MGAAMPEERNACLATPMANDIVAEQWRFKAAVRGRACDRLDPKRVDGFGLQTTTRARCSVTLVRRVCHAFTQAQKGSFKAIGGYAGNLVTDDEPGYGVEIAPNHLVTQSKGLNNCGSATHERIKDYLARD